VDDDAESPDRALASDFVAATTPTVVVFAVAKLRTDFPGCDEDDDRRSRCRRIALAADAVAHNTDVDRAPAIETSPTRAGFEGSPELRVEVVLRASLP